MTDSRSPAPVRPGLAGIRVLVIDDNATSVELLERRLARWEIRCDTAIDGQTAVEMLDGADEVRAGAA